MGDAVRVAPDRKRRRKQLSGDRCVGDVVTRGDRVPGIGQHLFNRIAGTVVSMGDRHLTPEVLTEWLSPHLGASRVVGVRNEPIGTGQMSESRRITLDYSHDCGLPATMVAKFESASEASRAAYRATRTYEVETAFYREIRDKVVVNAPRCFYNEFDGDADEFALLLSDFAPCTQGDQLAGCSVTEARAALREVAALHGPLWGDEWLKSMPWLHRNPPDKKRNVEALFGQLVPGFLDRYGARLSDVAREVAPRLVREGGDYFTYDPASFSVIHGDYRLDNMIFDSAAKRVLAVLDWELSTLGDPVADFAYHLMKYRLASGGVRGLQGVDLAALGLPTEREYVAAYCSRRGIAEIGDLEYYLAFCAFRLAGICHGIAGRVARGTAVSPQAKKYAAQVEPLAELAWQTAQRV